MRMRGCLQLMHSSRSSLALFQVFSLPHLTATPGHCHPRSNTSAAYLRGRIAKYLSFVCSATIRPALRIIRFVQCRPIGQRDSKCLASRSSILKRMKGNRYDAPRSHPKGVRIRNMWHLFEISLYNLCQQRKKLILLVISLT